MGRDLKGAFSSSILNSDSNILSSLKTVTSKMNDLSNSGFAQQAKLLGLDGGFGIIQGTTEDLLNGENWNTVGNVANKYLQSKIDRIKDACNTKVEMSIGALVGEAAPYVKNPGEAVNLLVDKIDDFIEYMLGVDGNGGGTLKSLIDDIGTDFLEYMMNDPSMQQVMSSLTIVKSFGQVIKVYAKAEEMIVKILSKIEPLIPILQIATNLASSYFSGGTSAAEASEEMTELVTKYSQELIALAIGAIKKYVFSIKIKMPSIIVGALNSLSVREAMRAGDWESDWLKAIFDEDFYNQTLYSLQWQDAINQAITTTFGSYADIAKSNLTFNFTNSKGEPITRGEFMKSRFMATLTASFMKSAIASARKTAYINDIDDQDYKTTTEEYGTSGASYSTSTSNTGSKAKQTVNAHLSNMLKITRPKDIISMSKNYCNA